MKRLHTISNQEIARILLEIADYLAMQEVPFKPRAYERAAETITALEEGLGMTYQSGGIKALKEIPGVGQAIAEKIEELLTTGKLKYYEELKRKTPVNLSELQTIEGLGPKSVLKLYQKLNIRTLADLERAARAGKIAKLEGFGPTSEQNILKGIEFHKGGAKRHVIVYTMESIRRLEELLKNRPDVERIAVAGSARRRKETIGDVDILIASKKSKTIMEYFVTLPQVARVFAHGETKSSVLFRSGLQVDLRVVPKESYGAALNYFTGSKDHNVSLRQLAITKGLKLNEYGLWRVTKGREQVIAGGSEEEIYKALGLRYIEPELRENTGEIEASRAGTLPNVIRYGELQGDLQVQTDWTDGAESIEAMAKAAAARGFKYIAITDHTKRLTITNGLDEKRIQKQWLEIDRVNKLMKGKITVLKGTECDILKDGTLDLPDNILSKLDIVGVSVHSNFQLSRKDQTERIIRAITNPNVDILFHPTGRIVGRRPPYDVDVEALIQTAKQTKTVLEVNSSERLDLKDEYIKMAVAKGVRLAIDSDAHASNQYDNLEFGIAQARRGWAEKKDVVNAWPLEKMMAFLK